MSDSPWDKDLTVEQCLNCLYTDFQMLKDGDWHPDTHTADASITVVERLAEILCIGLQDTREET
jgi:hypothetical protein